MFPGQCGNTAFFFKSQPDQFHFELRGIVFPGKSFFSAHEVSTCKISGCLSYRILDSGPDGTQTTLTFLLHGLSDHVGRGDVFNPQRRINGFMFFSLSVLNLEDHLGLVISPQSPLSAGYITLRACRRSLPLRFSTVTPGGIVGFLIVSYRFNIPDRLAVHLSIHARPELRAHRR